ncbi:Plasmid stabilization system protein [Pirellulimonas nuda]|uniref:Plasmid stabilization system protein n=1 Tax=Pirellulimonas nuda TaxID=2528009 RepID=A0A518D6X8_9BACT|nr:Plasmid stabilization system protein [Pirellulimonas nuda]
MSFKLRVTDPAKDDIRQIVTWWSEHRDAGQAQRWQIGLETRVRTLRQRPTSRPLAPESRYSSVPVRQLNYGVRGRPTHRVLFIVTENEVVVLRVLHLAQDALAPEDLGFDGLSNP